MIKNKYHIFWFIIDSVRTFRSGKDDRDRLDVMDEFSRDAIEFINCTTSAPSSLLSAAAMFTGLPSTFVSRHFNDFKVGLNELDTVASLVKIHGYQSFPIMDSRDIRIPFNHILPCFKKTYLPRGLKLSDYAWHNWELNEIFKSILDKIDYSKPACFTFWYDCRRDNKTSDYVKAAIEMIKKLQLYDEAIIIMHSDHGYPDPDTKMNEAFFNKIGHDMVLTDDNIKVPFFIKYPGCPKNVKIKNVIGTIDIIPTIFDILKLEYKIINSRYQGKSLLSIIDGKENESRIRISDTRLPMDKNRISAFRSTNRKYLLLHDSNEKYLFDLEKDPKELINLYNHKDYQEDLRKFISIQNDFENEIYLFHRNQLESNSLESFLKIKKWYPGGLERVLIVSNGVKAIVSLLAEKVSSILRCSCIDLLYSGHSLNEIEHISRYYKVDEISRNQCSSLLLEKYDLVIFLTENSSRVFLKESIRQGIMSIPAHRHVLMNFNFKLFNYFISRFLHSNKLKIFLDWDNKGFLYKQEPIFLIKDVGFFFAWAINKIIKTHFKKEKDFDLKAARDIMDYRKFHLEGNESGLSKMDEQQLANEFVRIKTRDS